MEEQRKSAEHDRTRGSDALASRGPSHSAAAPKLAAEPGPAQHAGVSPREPAAASRAAEEVLRASEARYRQLADLLPVAVYMCDATGMITYYNPQAARLWGRTPRPGDTDERFCGSEQMLLNGRVLPHDQCPMAVTLRDGSSFREQAVDIRRPDGALISVHVNIDPIKDERGRITGAINVFHDVTEIRRAEAAKARLVAIVESSADAIVSADLDGIINSWNRGAERTFGHAAEEALGRPLTMLIPAHRLDEAPRILERIARGEKIEPFETVRRRKDGTLLSVSLTISPIIDAAGRVTGVSEIARDVTQAKQAEQALRASEERFRTLADNISQLAWIADARGWIYWYNRRWYDYTGTTLEEMQGWGWKAVHHPEHVDRVVQRVQHSWDTGEIWEDTFPLRGKDGQYRWFLSRAVPIRDDLGRIQCWFGTNTDITEHYELERQRDGLLESERSARTATECALREKDEFLSVINHELHAPLAIVIGWTRMLRENKLEAEDARAALDAIWRGSQQLKHLINDLLDMSRALSGKLKLEPAPLNVVSLARDALADFQPQADKAKLRLEGVWPDQPLLALADAGRLRQVIGNLLTNALKFTPPGGRVQLCVRPSPAGVALSVEDTGIGIAPDVLPRLFARFQQADSSIARKFKGLGLGLALVRQIVELHGGTVRATSPGAGLGSTFVVELPRLQDSAVMDTDTAPGDTDLRGVRVLAVDDDPTALALTSRLLEEGGASVIPFTSGMEALTALEQESFDVLVSDISMPELDGYALLQRVRAFADAQRAAIPAVAVTAFGRGEDKQCSLEAGFAAHLTKPLDPAGLCATIRSLVPTRT